MPRKCCCVCSFCWEEAPRAPAGLARLLAVGAQRHLKLLEVEAERGASASLLCVWERSADQLLKVLREQDHGEGQARPPRAAAIIILCSVLFISDLAFACRYWRAALAAHPVVCCWPVRRAAEHGLAAAAAVATGRGGASDDLLLQHGAERWRQTDGCGPLHQRRDALHPSQHWTHLYPLNTSV